MAVILSFIGFSSVIFLLLFINASVWIEGTVSNSINSFPEDKILSQELNIFPLIPNKKYVKENDDEFGIYCFKNVQKSIFQIWRSVHLILLHKPLKYNLFPGVNASEVYSSYQSRPIWTSTIIYGSTKLLKLPFNSDSVIDFPAFSQYCVGIATKDYFSLLLQVRTINYWKVLQTVVGIFIFLTAPTLSRNVFFHYTSGVSFGVLASLLILLYIVAHFIPKKTVSYTLLVVGYSFFLYILRTFWQHLSDIIAQYSDIVLSYCVVAAFLSFAVCYRIGPVKSQRTCDIIQWSMQAVSLLIIFFSSEYREASTALILLLLIGKIIPPSWIKWAKYIWFRIFPPRIKLLSEIEYIEQGNVETKKALENLRKFCSSPDCNVWKVVQNLKDPTRFAHFIMSGTHYSDQELLEYNSEDFSNEFWETNPTETEQNHLQNENL